MKIFIVLAALAAMAVATPLNYDQLEAIIAAINSPNTDPATAELLENMLQDLIGAAVGPALVEQQPAIDPAFVEQQPAIDPALVEESEHEPPFAGPALIDFPAYDGSIAKDSPLVQIIVNIPKIDVPAPAPGPEYMLPAPAPAPEAIAPAPAPVPEAIAPAPAPAPAPVPIAPAPAPAPAH